MTQGKIIEYIDHGKFVCTICLQDKGNSLRLLTPSNREVKLPPKRAILISQKSINTEKPREDLVEILRQTEQLRIHLMEGINIKELWELVRDENEHFDNKYLAQLVFGREITDEHLSAVVRALFGDHLHFKMKDGRFLANSEEKVEQILKQREEEALKEERLNYGSAWLKDIQDGKSPDDPPHKEYIVDLLVQLALYGTDTPDAKYGKELLSKAGISDIQKARGLLIRLGIWEEDENLDLLRFGIETSFTEKQLSESARLAGIEPLFDGREDLRDLFVITIDGPFTQDFDDAVSFEIVGNELQLGIHIADVAGIILPDSILDKEAAKRATTLAEMLPEMYQMSRRLQQDRMSQDALRLSLPELQVVFHDDSSFSLTQDDQDTPSRMIIAELMILYNCLAGRFCRDNQIPALFRTQAEPSERLSEDEAGYIFYVFRQRRKLSPAHIETSAGPHSGLGLDAYIQASSPIRRYFDLVVQRQIRNFLMGEAPVYNEKELEEIRVFIEPVIKDFMNIKRNRIRYWTLKYISRHRGEKYNALVIDELRRKYRIVLCDFFLIAEIGRRNGVIMKPGEEFVVEVVKADPWEDVLKLEYGE